MKLTEQIMRISSLNFSQTLSPVFTRMFEEDRSSAMESEEAAAAFLEKATDVEVLVALSELSLQVPLSDPYFRIMMHLSQKLLTRAGVAEPEGLFDGEERLSSHNQGILESFKRDIRTKQGRMNSKEKRNVWRYNTTGIFHQWSQNLEYS